MGTGTTKKDEVGTIYMGLWKHTPETCPGRSKEGAKMLSGFWSRRAEWERKGVKILGAWVTVTGHGYYIVVQSKDFAAVTEFFLPLCPSQTGDFVPVLTMDEWITMNQPK
jgi:hypothetical protein